MDAPAREFLDLVLALGLRVAVFDCDDTLWSGDSGREFLYWELKHGLLPGPIAAWAKRRYDCYLEGKVSEEDMCGEMVTIHQGVREADIVAAAEVFFREHCEGNIFPEMREVTGALLSAGCQVWAVSSTNEWVVRAGARRFGIPAGRVLAACVHIEDGCATGTLDEVPTDEGKAASIRRHIPGRVDAVFGNSIHDLQMLELARHPFVINPTLELLAIARERGWPVYVPAAARGKS
ncbi:MAG: haloacid dehalogenase-like hydrolase [Acidobacteria bacterium]|nr:haloacid dehalogenase-like hydrolase [Acidobacteriota bacterium]